MFSLWFHFKDAFFGVKMLGFHFYLQRGLLNIRSSVALEENWILLVMQLA